MTTGQEPVGSLKNIGPTTTQRLLAVSVRTRHRAAALAFAAVVPTSVLALTPTTHTLQVIQDPVPSWTNATKWTLQEDLRLGSLDDPGPEQFGRIGALSSDADGRIYVLDVLAQQVRVFGADGSYSHTVGNTGEGPGEFLAATDIAFAPDGTFWVTDPVMTNRYSAFGPDGDFISSFPRRTLGRGARGGFLDDGTYVDWAVTYPDEREDVVAGSRIVLWPIRLSENFATADTLPPLEFRQAMIEELGLPQVYFKPRLETFVAADGGIWFTGTDGYQLFRRSLAGDTTLAITLTVQAALIVDADRQRIRDNHRGRTDVLSAYLDALPETKPVMRGIFGDNAGHIFVIPELEGVPAGAALDVFLESGDYLGRMELPVPISGGPRGGFGPLSPIHATKDHIYYVIADEFDVPYVSRLVITKPR